MKDIISIMPVAPAKLIVFVYYKLQEKLKKSFKVSGSRTYIKQKAMHTGMQIEINECLYVFLTRLYALNQCRIDSVGGSADSTRHGQSRSNIVN